MEVGDEIRNVSVAYGADGEFYENSDSGSEKAAYDMKGDAEAGVVNERKMH